MAVILTSLPAAAYAVDPIPGTTGDAPAGEVSIAAAPGAAASADALQPFQTFNVRGGYVSSGVAMRNRGFGTISVSGILSGSSIRAAYLFWAVLGNAAAPSFSQGAINGQPIAGLLVGISADPCWGNGASFGYRADVTALINGNGDYALSGFASGITDGRDPWNAGTLAPMSEGASLVVVYENPSSPSTQVHIYEGAAMTGGALLSQTLAGFTAPPQVGAATTTFIGADGQSASEPGSTFNGNPLPVVGWDGHDPQAGTRFSLGNLWDTTTADVTSLVAPGSTSATATVRGGPDCLVWVAQVLSISEPAAVGHVIFIHGINAPFTDVGFDPILPPLEQLFPGMLRRFEYYQDKGSVQNGQCRSIPVELPANGISIPYDASSIDETICDSQSDLGLNAVRLDSYIQEQYAEGGNRPVVLIANSMGAAIVRGFLAYSAEADDGVATSMVDSVIYLEGAQDGTVWGHIDRFETSLYLAAIQDVLEPFARDAFPGDLSRPAAGELAPVSLWYQWTNPPVSHLPSVPSFNLFGDLRVVVKTEVPFLGPISADLGSVGDVALMPGTDNPHDLPPEGGARFLDGPLGAENWQWQMTGELAWEPFSDPFLGAGAFAGQVTSAPIFHGNFGNQMNAISVPSCKGGLGTTVATEVVRIVTERMTGRRDNCDE